MGEFRDAMLAELRLLGYAERTCEAYTYCVREQVRFTGVPPDQIGAEQVRSYLLHLAERPVLSVIALLDVPPVTVTDGFGLGPEGTAAA